QEVPVRPTGPTSPSSRAPSATAVVTALSVLLSHVWTTPAYAEPVTGVGVAAQGEAAGFEDVAGGHTFAAEIDWLVKEGITRSCNLEGRTPRFYPDEPVTRGQMAAFLTRSSSGGSPSRAGPCIRRLTRKCQVDLNVRSTSPRDPLNTAGVAQSSAPA